MEVVMVAIPAHRFCVAVRRMAGRVGRDERGQSMSLFFLFMVIALVIVVGLVVDGGQKTHAVVDANWVARQAARAGVDAGGRVALGDRDSAAVAVRAAQAYLAGSPGVVGTVSLLPGGRIKVETSITVPTYYLSLIGINTVTGYGSAIAELHG